MNTCVELGCLNSAQSSGRCKTHYGVEYRRRKLDRGQAAYGRQGFEQFLEYKWEHMKRRRQGHVGNKFKKYYETLKLYPLPSREEFVERYRGDFSLKCLFAAWVFSDYSRILCPVPDRLNSDKGYTFDNIEWITSSENSKRAWRQSWRAA